MLAKVLTMFVVLITCAGLVGILRWIEPASNTVQDTLTHAIVILSLSFLLTVILALILKSI